MEYGWIIGRGDPVPHVEQPLNDTDTRRFWVEFLKNGKRQEVDAQSLRIWRTAELPRFRIEEPDPQFSNRKSKRLLNQKWRLSTGNRQGNPKKKRD